MKSHNFWFNMKVLVAILRAHMLNEFRIQQGPINFNFMGVLFSMQDCY